MVLAVVEVFLGGSTAADWACVAVVCVVAEYGMHMTKMASRMRWFDMGAEGGCCCDGGLGRDADLFDRMTARSNCRAIFPGVMRFVQAWLLSVRIQCSDDFYAVWVK